MNGLDDEFLTYIAFILSKAGESGPGDVVAVVVDLLGLKDDLELLGCMASLTLCMKRGTH